MDTNLLTPENVDFMWGVVTKYVSNRALQQDVMQEALIAVWSDAKDFQGRSKVTTWLFQITRNCARMALRSLASRVRNCEEDLNTSDGTVCEFDSGEPSPDMVAGHREELFRCLQDLARISNMSDRTLGTFIDHIFNGDPTPDLAVRHGMPKKTVVTRVFNVRSRLLEMRDARRGLSLALE